MASVRLWPFLKHMKEKLCIVTLLPRNFNALRLLFLEKVWHRSLGKGARRSKKSTGVSDISEVTVFAEVPTLPDGS